MLDEEEEELLLLELDDDELVDELLEQEEELVEDELVDELLELGSSSINATVCFFDPLRPDCFPFFRVPVAMMPS